MTWTDNTIMTWVGLNDEGELATFKVSDHSRESLNVGVERVGSDRRTANGTLRRFQVKNNRTWSMSWSVLPSINGASGYLRTADGGMSGRQMEDFYDNNPGRFRMVIRAGSASGKTTPSGALAFGPKFEDEDFYGADVMITEFSHEVSKRSSVDLWSVNATLEEV